MRLMYDSDEPGDMPDGGDVYWGYITGRLAETYAATKRAHPGITGSIMNVYTSGVRADAYDMETGALSLSQLITALRQHGDGAVVYVSVSRAQTTVDALAAAGIPRSTYFLWTAHYSIAHVCSPSCGFGLRGVADATQYGRGTSTRHYDTSVAADSFMPSFLTKTPAPAPAPAPTPATPTPATPVTIPSPPGGHSVYNPPFVAEIVAAVNCPTGGVWCVSPDGHIWAINCPASTTAGGMPAGNAFWAGRTARDIVLLEGGGFVVIDTAGEAYAFPVQLA